MAINLSNFVDIKINYHLTTSSVGTRDTAVLIVGTNSTKQIHDVKTLKEFTDLGGNYSYTDLDNNPNSLYYYGFCFFSNGGKKLRIIELPYSNSPIWTSAEEQGYTQPTDFVGHAFVLGLGSEVSATPQNSNKNGNGGVLLVEGSEIGTYVSTTDTEFVDGTTYYYNGGTEEEPEYIPATPANCGLYTKTFVPNTSLVAQDIVDEATGVGNDYIVITSNATWDVMKNANDIYNKEEKGISSKMFLSAITPTEYDDNEKSASDVKKSYISSRDGFSLKYGRKGIEMTIAAYLTQINANRFNSIKDYDFTIETVSYDYIVSAEEKRTYTSVYDDNDLVEALMKNNINVVSTLVNATRNLGGNDTLGHDIVNEFMLILLHQTLTDRLVQLLSQKIKYNQTGLSLIGATIASELQRYVDNGYLTTDKVWTDPDLIVEGITIITQNSPLQIGYKYVIFPFSSLTTEERAEHKLPPIYILIADSYSIRKIEINGEVF